MKRIHIDDVVKVVDKQSVHLNKVGIVLPNTSDYMYLVALENGRTVHQFRRDELALVARKGTKPYTQYVLTGQIGTSPDDSDKTELTLSDYLDLIDLALDLNDFDLVQYWLNKMNKIK